MKGALRRFSCEKQRDLTKCQIISERNQCKKVAIYHLNVRVSTRANQQSAVAKSLYISRSGKYAKTGDEVLHHEFGNLPTWASRPANYWQAADQYERANGSLLREIEFALPRELELDQQIELAQIFAKTIVGKSHFYEYAIHAGKGENPHCHLIFSERIQDGIERPREQFFKRANKADPERGGCVKSRTWYDKDYLLQVRARWAATANFYLEKNGHAGEKIDHRSYAERGIMLIPQPKLRPSRRWQKWSENDVKVKQRRSYQRDNQNENRNSKEVFFKRNSNRNRRENSLLKLQKRSYDREIRRERTRNNQLRFTQSERVRNPLQREFARNSIAAHSGWRTSKNRNNVFDAMRKTSSHAVGMNKGTGPKL